MPEYSEGGSTARARRITYARQAIANPLKDSQTEHPEVDLMWVERAIVEPEHQLTDRGRTVYFSRVPGDRQVAAGGLGE